MLPTRFLRIIIFIASPVSTLLIGHISITHSPTKMLPTGLRKGRDAVVADNLAAQMAKSQKKPGGGGCAIAITSMGRIVDSRASYVRESFFAILCA